MKQRRPPRLVGGSQWGIPRLYPGCRSPHASQLTQGSQKLAGGQAVGQAWGQEHRASVDYGLTSVSGGAAVFTSTLGREEQHSPEGS